MIFKIGYDDSWFSFFNNPGVKAVICDIESQLEGEEFYPLAGEVLRFASVDLSKVRYVLIGQDPYPSYDNKHGRPQATGRSFEVSELIDQGWDYPIRQRSLHNILKAIYFTQTGNAASMSEIRNSISAGTFNVAPPGELFDILERQGVLFLNATLTVPPGKPGKHHGLWSGFRSLLVRYIIEQNPDARWVLWGKGAETLIGPLPSHIKKLPCCHPRQLEFIEQSNISAIDVNWAS